MKDKNRKLLAVALLMPVGMMLCTSSVFASNPYGINYSGGEVLGVGNVQENPELIESLKQLISYEKSKIVFSDSGRWEDAYYTYSGKCEPVKYFRVGTDSVTSKDNLGFVLSNDTYQMDVKINKVVLDLPEGVTMANDAMVGVRLSNNALIARYKIYSDATCETLPDNVRAFSYAAGLNEDKTDFAKVFVDTNVVLTKKSNNEKVISDELYFGLMDIDGVQSFKMPNNKLTKNNMFAKNLNALQPVADSDIDAKNRFVASGGYIYSEASASKGTGFDLKGGNGIFVKIGTAAQKEGLNVVFGFGAAAGSGIQYYTEQFTVNYASDDGGKITGVADESIIAGQSPSGSVVKPNGDYVFKYWIADVDVTLNDGSVIKAGEAISNEQLANIVVNQNINFTAVNGVVEVAVPDTGINTKEMNAAYIAVPIVGILAAALLVKLTPRAMRKKIGFDK